MNTVYVEGSPRWGLGNILFQVAAAIYYCEKYNYKLVLIRSHWILFGTSIMFGKDQCFVDQNNNKLTYDETIFKKLIFMEKIMSPAHECIVIHNNYTNTKIVPTNNYDLIIKGFSQNISLFKEYIHKIPNYLNIEDINIKNYINNKYGNIENSIAICIRIGNDFRHMNKINSNSYLKALDYLKTSQENMEKIYIISDTPNISNHFSLNEHYDYIEVNEKDIVQFYFGLACKNYILSESTFHLWIAYLGTIDDNNKKVICFNNTDITNRKLELENWIKISY
jgi:hypothetical protein